MRLQLMIVIPYQLSELKRQQRRMLRAKSFSKLILKLGMKRQHQKALLTHPMERLPDIPEGPKGSSEVAVDLKDNARPKKYVHEVNYVPKEAVSGMPASTNTEHLLLQSKAGPVSNKNNASTLKMKASITSPVEMDKDGTLPSKSPRVNRAPLKLTSDKVTLVPPKSPPVDRGTPVLPKYSAVDKGTPVHPKSPAVAKAALVRPKSPGVEKTAPVCPKSPAVGKAAGALVVV